MRRVAASEHDLLTIARALVGQQDPAVVQPLLRQARKLPTRLGETAAELLEQTLSRGVLLQVARMGGWRSERFIVDGTPATGRLWERHPPQPLPFSAFSMELLRWLAREPVEASAKGSLKPPKRLQLGDELLLYLTAQLLVDARLKSVLPRQRVFHESALVWLGFADVLVTSPDLAEVPSDAFRTAFSPDRAWVLEALQPELASKWTAMERRKATIVSNETMSILGSMQTRVLNQLFEGADRTRRRDLCIFVLQAAAGLLDGTPMATHWAGALSRDGSLRARSEARRHAGAFLRSLDRWAQWNEAHQGSRFFDDDYQASQHLLSAWETVGDSTHARARSIVRSLEQLDAATA